MSDEGTLTLDAPRQEIARPAPANDLRHAMMSLPVDRQNTLLAQYKASRDNFRKWLMEQLIEGVHYGVPPGCEPATKEINGVIHYGVWNKRRQGGPGYDWHPPTQWQPKPSLYAAGADFICDIMGVRDEYDTDVVGWQQMGSKAGNAVVKCHLKSRATDELIGESLGAYYDSDPNSALKMASKCAKVGAVINAYDLRDLFTQEQLPPAPHDNPPADEGAPKAAPRAARAKKGKKPDGQYIWECWLCKNASGDNEADRGEFRSFVSHTTNRFFDPFYASQWVREDVEKCCRALNIELPWEEIR